MFRIHLLRTRIVRTRRFQEYHINFRLGFFHRFLDRRDGFDSLTYRRDIFCRSGFAWQKSPRGTPQTERHNRPPINFKTLIKPFAASAPKTADINFSPLDKQDFK